MYKKYEQLYCACHGVLGYG